MSKTLERYYKRSEVDVEQIRQFYHDRKVIMMAIGVGNKAIVIKKQAAMAEHIKNWQQGQDTEAMKIRHLKNMCIGLNTAYSLGAESGGLPLAFCYQLSSDFNEKIERATSIQSVNQIASDMPGTYCLYVLNFKTKSYSPIMKDMVVYIFNNVNSGVNLNELSEVFGKNNAFISRKFKKETGMTVSEFINSYKIGFAKRMLRLDDMNITTAAHLSGYNDSNYFTKVFKKYTGMTPSQWIEVSSREDSDLEMLDQMN